MPNTHHQSVDPRLVRDADALPEPRNYFRGHPDRPVGLPTNILLFQRRVIQTRQYSQHGRHVLIICLDVPGELGIGGRVLRLEPGQATLVLPYRPHYYLTRDIPINWLFITFDMRTADSPHELDALPIPLLPDDQDLLADLQARYLAAGRQDPALPDPLIAMSLGLFLLRLCSRHRASGDSPAADLGQPQVGPDDPVPGINDVVQRIYGDLADLPTIDGLAAEAGLSASYLRARFRQRYGVSLGQFIRDARMQEAARLLRQSDLRIGEISQRVGFDSAFAFSRAFRQHSGMAPRDFRRRPATDPA